MRGMNGNNDGQNRASCWDTLRSEYASRLNIAFDALDHEDYEYARKVFGELGHELVGFARGC